MTAPVAPEPVENRPALGALSYRIGTYASFLEAMRERLATTPELKRLTTRAGDDYAITVLELWAAVADVLTFYQERYANEAFLRTATLRESVARLTALIGYRLRPGAAATALLAFDVQAGTRLTIPAGFRVQSVPGPGAQPQTFETLADLAADGRFDRLRVYPPPTAAAPFAAGSTEFVLDRERGPELAAGLAAGARVLLFEPAGTGGVEEKHVASVRTEDDRVVVAWSEPVQQDATGGVAYRAARSFRIAGHDAPPTYMTPSAGSGGQVTWTLTTLSGAGYSYVFGTTLHLDAVYQGLAAGQLLLIETPGSTPATALVRVVAARTGAVTFGPATATVSILDVDRVLELAPRQPAVGLVPRLLVREAPPAVATETSAAASAHGSLGLSLLGSRGPLLGSVVAHLWSGDRRQIVVHELVGEPLAPWDETYADTFTPGTVCLPGRFAGTASDPAIELGRTVAHGALAPGVVVRPAELEVGRPVFLVDAAGDPVQATIAAPASIDAPDASGFCHLRLTLALAGAPTLETASAALLGNVVEASHGETVAREVLGNGDASQAFQTFALQKPPLTYLAGPGSPDPQPSLEVRVDDVRWTAVPSLYGRGRAERVYEVETNEDDSSSVRFGDGATGARAATGSGNVTATYRHGSGLAGQVDAGTLRTALQRPPGLLGVTNPLAAHGASEPDDADAARTTAPRTVRTFGRAVSLTDFEEFTTASGAAAKAQATWVWSGFERVVYLTVAGSGGVQLDEDDLETLAQGLTAVRDPNHRLVVANYRPVPVVVSATIGVDPAYERDAVQAAARAALLDSLSFDRLELGGSLHLGDVYATLQAVPGVAWVDVDRFRQRLVLLALMRTPLHLRLPGLLPPHVQPDVVIRGAVYDATDQQVFPAELAAVASPAEDVVVSVDAGASA